MQALSRIVPLGTSPTRKPLGVILGRQCNIRATDQKLTFNATFTAHKFDRIE
jgi:hypothetical protein